MFYDFNKHSSLADSWGQYVPNFGGLHGIVDPVNKDHQIGSALTEGMGGLIGGGMAGSAMGMATGFNPLSGHPQWGKLLATLLANSIGTAAGSQLGREAIRPNAMPPAQ